MSPPLENSAHFFPQVKRNHPPCGNPMCFVENAITAFSYRVTQVLQSKVVELKVKTQLQVHGFAMYSPVVLNKLLTLSILY